MKREADVKEARAILAEAAGVVPPQEDESLRGERDAERRRQRRRQVRKPLGGPAAPRMPTQPCEVDAAVVGIRAHRTQSPAAVRSPSRGAAAVDSASDRVEGDVQLGDESAPINVPLVPGSTDGLEGSQSPLGPGSPARVGREGSHSPRGGSLSQHKALPASARGARPAALAAALASEEATQSMMQRMHVHPTSPNSPASQCSVVPASAFSTGRGDLANFHPVSRAVTTTLDLGLPLEMSVQTEEADLVAPPSPVVPFAAGSRDRPRNGRTVIVQRCDPRHVDLRRWGPVEWQPAPPSAEVRYLAHVRSRFPGTIDSGALSGGKQAPGAVKRAGRTPRAR